MGLAEESGVFSVAVTLLRDSSLPLTLLFCFVKSAALSRAMAHLIGIFGAGRGFDQL